MTPRDCRRVTRWIVLAGHKPDAPACDFMGGPYTAAELARDVAEARAAYARIVERHGEVEAFRLFRHMAAIVEEAKAECQPDTATPAGPPAPSWSGRATATTTPVAGASPRAASSAPASCSKRMLPGTEPTDLERRTAAGKRGR